MAVVIALPYVSGWTYNESCVVGDYTNFSADGLGYLDGYNINNTIDGDRTEDWGTHDFFDVGLFDSAIINITCNASVNFTGIEVNKTGDGSGGNAYPYNISAYVGGQLVHEYYYDGGGGTVDAFNVTFAEVVDDNYAIVVHSWQANRNFYINELAGYGELTLTPAGDSTPPVVTINAPDNNTNDTSLTQIINITCYDETQVSNISFIVNDTIEQTNTTPVNNTAWVFDYTFSSYAYYTYYANCSDGTNEAQTGLYNINLTEAATNATATNCTDCAYAIWNVSLCGTNFTVNSTGWFEQQEKCNGGNMNIPVALLIAFVVGMFGYLGRKSEDTNIKNLFSMLAVYGFVAVVALARAIAVANSASANVMTILNGFFIATFLVAMFMSFHMFYKYFRLMLDKLKARG